jgi:hypothetical protein
MRLLDRLCSDAVLERAFLWLCRQRRRWPDASDVWSFRSEWPAEQACLRAELRAGTFRFGLLDRIHREGGEQVEVFASRDAVALKTLALVLEHGLPVSRRCTHVKGHGGAKAAIRRLMRRLPQARFVLRTDVRGYYPSIDPVRLVERLARFVPDPQILRLVAQLTARTSERGGHYFDSGGLPLGCPLSPLLGAFFLRELDERLEHSGLFFVRYMDDIAVLAPTRWKLRRAVKIVNQTLSALGLEKHPEKAFIGRVERGFDFLGYRLSPKRLQVAKATVDRFVERARRLYEQERGKSEDFPRLGAYVRRWLRWVEASIARGALGAALCRLSYPFTSFCARVAAAECRERP